jgi:hypothetical protein
VTPGTKVRITGWRSFTGTILAANEVALTIQEAPGFVAILRRDPASTAPLQWRCAGRPVEVFIMPDAVFRKRLADLKGRQPR